jgi:TolA-binding protein
MNDPDRLSEGTGDLGATLLRSAKRYRVSEETRQRALATLLGTASAGGMKPPSKAAFSPAKLALWGLPAALVLTGGYLLVSPGSGQVQPTVNSASAVLSAARLPHVAETPAPPVPASVPAHQSPVASASPGNNASSAALNATQASMARSSSSSDLAGELAALDGAAKAIQAGNGAGALTQLNAYTHAFPHGSLDLEAKVLRAEALQSAGRHDEAVAGAKAFVAHYPKSPLAVRMRRLAGE